MTQASERFPHTCPCFLLTQVVLQRAVFRKGLDLDPALGETGTSVCHPFPLRREQKKFNLREEVTNLKRNSHDKKQPNFSLFFLKVETVVQTIIEIQLFFFSLLFHPLQISMGNQMVQCPARDTL